MSDFTQRLETYPSIEAYRESQSASRVVNPAMLINEGYRPRGEVDPELPEEWEGRPVVRASDSPALAERRKRADEFERKRAKREGRLEEYEASRDRQEIAKAERERIDATAREELEREAEEAQIERAKARIRRDAEAGPA
jgi:hypothetical protein